VKDNQMVSYKYGIDYFLQKANQHWELAGLARMDGDHKDAERHTKLARDWDRKAREV
jgi:hypothetical protein